jgi:PST family polysaccharide transporter
VILGFITGLGVALFGPALAWLLGNPALTAILQVLAITFVISSLGNVKRALLQRELSFNTLAQVELLSALMNGATAIILALCGWKVWALVAGSIAGTVTATAHLWISVPWRPRWCCRWPKIKTVIGFSLNLTGSQILNYFIFNADHIIIGRFLGATPLGFYALAQRILMTPVLFITQTLTKVLFPAFARIQDDDAEIRQKYLRACSGMAMVNFPLMAMLGIVAHPFVIAVFGAKWIPLHPLIIILAPIGLIQSIATTVGVIYLAKGRTGWLLWWQIISGVLTTASFLIGLKWGVLGVASAYGVTILILTYPAFAIPFRLIGLKFVDLVSALRPYALATAVMSVLVLGCRLTLEQWGFEVFVVLTFCLGTGAVAYTAIILLLRPVALEDFQRMFFLKIKRRSFAETSL